MPRSRSAAVRKAKPSWHSIFKIEAKEYREKSESVRQFYEKHLGTGTRLEIELGSGSGTFLVEAARKNSGVQFVGIEYAQKFIRLIRDKIEEAGLNNILLLHTDGRAFIRTAMPEASVDVFHVYFPDPWPKRSQTKHRSLSLEGMGEFARALKPGGLLYFATDHEGYARSVEADLAEQKYFDVLELVRKTPEAGESNYTAYGLTTHFGERYTRIGKSIFSVRLKKKA